MKEENCKHEVLEPVLCRKCNAHLIAHEEEIMNDFIEIAGFCPNKECDFYKVLIA